MSYSNKYTQNNNPTSYNSNTETKIYPPNKPFKQNYHKYPLNNLSTNIKGKNVEISWKEIDDNNYFFFNVNDIIYNLGELWLKLIPIEDKLSKEEMPQHLINTEIYVRLADVKGIRVIKD